MSEKITVTLEDDSKLENKKFSNLVDPILWSVLMERFKSTSEKRSLEELVQALLEGR
jgi:hypothetical protein